MPTLLPCLLVLLLAAGHVSAQGAGSGIAAVVNDDIITTNDLEGRMRMTIAGANLEDTAETRQRLEATVLRSLADELLQRQAARAAGIEITEAEIDQALAQVAQQNNLDLLGFTRTLAQRGVPISALRGQITAQIAWAKLVQRRLRPQINVTDAQVDQEIERLQQAAGTAEYLLGEIVLPADTPQQRQEMQNFAERLVTQIRQGASFVTLARQFSLSANAAQGGDLGWVRAGQLPEELDRVVTTMRPGTISRPIQTQTGWHIILMRDVRTLGGDDGEVQVDLRQYLVPLAPNPSPEAQQAAVQEAVSISRTVEGCAAMEAAIAGSRAPDKGQLGSIRMSQLPEAVRNSVRGLPIGRPSQPLSSPNGVSVLMVCARTGIGGALPREEVRGRLGNQELDRAAKRLLSDLRESAVIDVRR